MSEICVLGTGMAGYGAAHRLREAGVRPVIFDKRGHYGGHTASFGFEGKYTFDEGPHVSFTKHERLQKLFADSIDGKYETLHTKVNNYWKGHWIKHPAQVNLYGLPTELIVNVIRDFVEAQHTRARGDRQLRAMAARQLREHVRRDLPDGVHDQVPHHRGEEQEPRLDRPAAVPGEARGGPARRAACPPTPDVHYISDFRYPSHGGFVSYLKRFMETADLRLGHALDAIDPKAKEVSFANGVTVAYEGLVSSVPLPDLVPTIEGAPRDVLEAAARLACTEVVIVNLVVDRPTSSTRTGPTSTTRTSSSLA